MNNKLSVYDSVSQTWPYTLTASQSQIHFFFEDPFLKPLVLPFVLLQSCLLIVDIVISCLLSLHLMFCDAKCNSVTLIVFFKWFVLQIAFQ